MAERSSRLSAAAALATFRRSPGTAPRGDGFGRTNRVLVAVGESIMPPRQPALPEGTDHVVRGASGSSSGDDGQAGAGFVASAGNGGSGTDRLVSQGRDHVTNLRGQAAERARGLADDGKGRGAGRVEGGRGGVHRA